MQALKKCTDAVRSGGTLHRFLTAAVLVGQGSTLVQLQAEGWLTTLSVHWPAGEEEMGLHTAGCRLEIPLVEDNNYT